MALNSPKTEAELQAELETILALTDELEGESDEVRAMYEDCCKGLLAELANLPLTVDATSGEPDTTPCAPPQTSIVGRTSMRATAHTEHPTPPQDGQPTCPPTPQNSSI